jgi:hypothetical protein
MNKVMTVVDKNTVYKYNEQVIIRKETLFIPQVVLPIVVE